MIHLSEGGLWPGGEDVSASCSADFRRLRRPSETCSVSPCRRPCAARITPLPFRAHLARFQGRAEGFLIAALMARSTASAEKEPSTHQAWPSTCACSSTDAMKDSSSKNGSFLLNR